MIRLLASAMLLAAFGLPRPALASCTYGERQAIELGMRFLRDAQAYDRRDEKDLAAADYENLGHQVELVSDEMKNCADPKITVQYYMLESYDIWQRYLHLAGTSSDQQLKQKMAWTLRSMVNIFYLSGGNTAYPKDYIDLKASVQAAYRDSGLKYCSPEKSDCPDMP